MLFTPKSLRGFKRAEWGSAPGRPRTKQTSDARLILIREASLADQFHTASKASPAYVDCHLDRGGDISHC